MRVSVNVEPVNFVRAKRTVNFKGGLRAILQVKTMKALRAKIYMNPIPLLHAIQGR